MTLKIGDYAETDRHFGQISWDFGGYPALSGRHQFELQRLVCLHDPQVNKCTPYERVFATQLKPSPFTEALVIEVLGEEYFA